MNSQETPPRRMKKEALRAAGGGSERYRRGLLRGAAEPGSAAWGALSRARLKQLKWILFDVKITAQV